MLPQTLNTGYLKTAPFPGSLFFLKLIMIGCDVHWLLTGSGRAPDPMTAEEMTEWIDRCRREVEYWEKRRDLELLVSTQYQDQYLKVAEMESTYKTKKGKKK
jgi:hypothetical protein